MICIPKKQLVGSCELCKNIYLIGSIPIRYIYNISVNINFAYQDDKNFARGEEDGQLPVAQYLVRHLANQRLMLQVTGDLLQS